MHQYRPVGMYDVQGDPSRAIDGRGPRCLPTERYDLTRALRAMPPRASRSPAPRSRGQRVRDPAATRERLVAAAFEEIHRHGYQGAGLDTILANAGVTKGALYHHFADKADLAHAVIDEVIRGLTLTRWTGPLAAYTGEPIARILKRREVVAY